MGNCLLNVCPGVCTDTSLPLLGEMRIFIRRQNEPADEEETPGAAVITLAASEALTVRADGSGTFLSAEGAEPLGAELTVPADTPTAIYPAEGDYNIRIVSKYALTQIDIGEEPLDDDESSGDENENPSATGETDGDAPPQISMADAIAELGAFLNRAARRRLNPPDRNPKVRLKDLQYATGLLRYHDPTQSTEGDLAAFASLAALRHIHIEGGDVYGNLAALAGKPDLEEVRLALKKDFLTGNISAFAQSTNLKEVICCQSAKVTGDLAVFADKTELTALCFDSPSVFGELSSLYGCTRLTSLRIPNALVTGDLAALREHCPLLTDIDVSGTEVTNAD